MYINDNIKSNVSMVLPFHELNSFDLNSLKPEWVVDNFRDNDSPSDVNMVRKQKLFIYIMF